VALAVFADIGGAEPLRHDEIELERAALPVAPDRVAQYELELGTIECPLAGVHRVGQAGGLDRLPEPRLRVVPHFVGSGPPWRKICTWPGQFIGFTARTRSSALCAINMFSRNFSQWPEASQSERSMSCGVFTSR